MAEKLEEALGAWILEQRPRAFVDTDENAEVCAALVSSLGGFVAVEAAKHGPDDFLLIVGTVEKAVRDHTFAVLRAAMEKVRAERAGKAAP